MAVLDGDPGKLGSFTVRLKAPAGYKIAPHTHPTTERVTGISGTARLGMGEKFDETSAKEVAPGTFVVLPAKMAHFAMFPEESIIQIQSEGPFKIKYVNPADDPRNAKKQ
jgi:quercetin dioxygenase-like cupin family protein